MDSNQYNKLILLLSEIQSENVQTMSMKPSAGDPKKHGAHRDRRACTSHNTPVIYVPAGSKVRSGQPLSIPGRQLSLHELLPIEIFPQPGPYTGPYYTKAHDQRE